MLGEAIHIISTIFLLAESDTCIMRLFFIL